jgi:hypothetical protein
VIEKLDVSSGCDVAQHFHGVIFETPAGGTFVLDPFVVGVVDVGALVEDPVQNFLRVSIVSATPLGNIYIFSLCYPLKYLVAFRLDIIAKFCRGFQLVQRQSITRRRNIVCIGAMLE